MPESNRTEAGDVAGGGSGDRFLIRAATKADIEEFYPGVGASFQAWVAEVDGEFAAIAGIALTRPYANLFSVIRDRSVLGRFAIWKVVRRIETTFKDMGLPIQACAEPGETSGLLTRMGLRKIDTVEGIDLYEWRGS